MATLFELNEELKALEELLAEVGGDVSEQEAEAAVDEWLATIQGDIAEKLDAYRGRIRELENRARFRKEEADRIRSLVKIDENAVKVLKDRLAWFMDGRNLKRIQTTYGRLDLATNGGVQPISLTVHPENVPTAFTKTTVVPDMEKIRKALESGAVLGFAVLEPRGKHVRIT